MVDNTRQQINIQQNYLNELSNKLDALKDIIMDNAVNKVTTIKPKVIALSKRERQLVRRLKKKSMSITNISQAFGIETMSAYQYTHILKKKGVNILNKNMRFYVE